MSCTILKNIIKLSEMLDIDKKNTVVSVFDYSSSTGRNIAEVLSHRVKEVRLFCKDITAISKKNGRIKYTQSLEEITKNSHFIINTGLHIPSEALDYIKPGTIILDATIPFITARTLSQKKKRRNCN